MNRAIALVDRHAEAAIKLLVAIGLLFFLAFAATLVIATGQARAQRLLAAAMI